MSDASPRDRRGLVVMTLEECERMLEVRSVGRIAAGISESLSSFRFSFVSFTEQSFSERLLVKSSTGSGKRLRLRSRSITGIPQPVPAGVCWCEGGPKQ